MLTEGGTCLELSEDDDVKKNQLELAHVTQIRLQNTKLKELSKEKKETLILIASRAVCVYLDNNRLKSLPAELQSFTALRELHLENNLLKKLSKKLFSLETLEELHLRGNQLTEIPGHIRNLKNLRLIKQVISHMRSHFQRFLRAHL
jgi:Leucine-rich repeat (LRR) protein